MTKYTELKAIRQLSKRGDSNSVVDLVENPNTNELLVRKIIFGIDQPLYQGIFTREVRALSKLNTCDNIVKIIGHRNLTYTNHTTNEKQKVGCIVLEFISGETLANTDILDLTTKEKFKIVKQLLSAIEIAHFNGIIHRDINPNNIMIDDNGDVKVIDFGICKIKEMVNNSTVYNMGTNMYSAPEVHMHSQNATEQSDLYSIGAVLYFLFTGELPPNVCNFQTTIDRISGIDIELKPIIKKLVEVDPINRYKDVSELKNDLSNIFTRFLDVKYRVAISMDSFKFSKLKNINLIPSSATISDINIFLPKNFVDLYINQDNNYEFLGANYSLMCSYNSATNIFEVLDIKKIVPLEREKKKKKFCEVSAKLDFVNPRFIHKLSRNDNLEIKNIVDDYSQKYRSKHNVDAVYQSKYGAWRNLLTITKKSVEDSAIRYAYDSYDIKNNICSFHLKDGVFLGDIVFSKESKFSLEKETRGQKRLFYIGEYEEDIFENDKVILKVRFNKRPTNLPKSGTICIDYKENIVNIDRQLSALDNIEREDYSCQHNLKEIFAGVTPPKVSVLSGNIKYFNTTLDASQRKAVEKALNSDSLAIIQGPPGTGKTNVIIEIIRQILLLNSQYPDFPEKKILLVSQSHPAVDKMLDDLIKQSERKPNLIRVGRDEKLNNEIREDYGLNYVKENWIGKVRKNCETLAESYFKELDISSQEFDEYYEEYEKQYIANAEKESINTELLNSFQAKTNTPSKNRIRKILEVQKQWTEQIQRCDEAELYVIKNTTIIAGTCTGFISNKIIRDVEFDYVIVDEAAKATYPELAVSFSKAEKIILVGDHKQLPPVLDEDIIKSNKETIRPDDFKEGLFEKLYNNFPEENKQRLITQYRMHPVIGTLISKVFYENEIQNGVKAEGRNTGISGYEETAIEWISTSNLSAKKRFESKVGSQPNYTFKNNAELNIIKNKLKELDGNATRTIKVGVITAYRAQKFALKEMINQNNFVNLQIDVDTVDAFQGGQKEIIIYSTVRSSDSAMSIGFLKSEARLNVSLSRAQSLLIIVGDLVFLNNPRIKDNKFPEIIEYIQENQGCKITCAGDE